MDMERKEMYVFNQFVEKHPEILKIKSITDKNYILEIEYYSYLDERMSKDVIKVKRFK